MLNITSFKKSKFTVILILISGGSLTWSTLSEKQYVSMDIGRYNNLVIYISLEK